MSPELKTRVRHYAEHLDELAPPVTFTDLIDREVEPVTMPEIERRLLSTRRRAWVAVAAAVLVLLVIGGAALLLGSLGTEPDLIDEPTTTTAVETTVTASPESAGLSIHNLATGTDLSAPDIGMDEAGNPVVVYRHQPGGLEVEIGQVEIVHCADPVCADMTSANAIQFSGAEVNVYTSFAPDGSPVIIVAAQDEVPELYRCADPGCSDYIITPLESDMWIGDLTVDPTGNPVMLVTIGQEEPVTQLITCLDATCVERTAATLDLPDTWGWSEMTFGQDGFPFIVHITSDPERGVNPTYVLHCGDATCSGDNTVSHVHDAPENTGNVAVSVGSDGLPVITLGSRQIEVLACSDARCTELSSVNQVGGRAIIESLMLFHTGPDQNPVLAYGAAHGVGEPPAPMLAVCADSTCATGTIGAVDDLPSIFLSGTASPGGGLRLSYGTWEELWVASCGGSGCGTGLLDPATWDQTPVTPTTTPPLGALMEGWARVPHDPAVFGPGGGGGFFSLVKTGPGLFATGDTCELVDGNSVCEAGIWVSNDRTNWEQVASAAGGPGAQPVTVAGGPNGLVAVGGICPEDGGPCEAKIWTSEDGFSWEPLTVSREVFGCPDEPECDFRLEGIVEGGPGLVAWGGGFAGNGIWTSIDGTSWEPAQTVELPPGTLINDIVTFGGRLIAVGDTWTDIFDDSGEWVGFEEKLLILTSEDGITWSRVPDARGEFAGSSAGRVAVWEQGITITGAFCDADWNCFDQVWNSSNGLIWTRAPLELGIDQGGLFSMIAGGPGLIAAGHVSDELQESSTTVFWTSADGITWDVHESDPAVFAEREHINVLAWFDNRLVGAGSSGVDRAPAVWIWTP